MTRQSESDGRQPTFSHPSLQERISEFVDRRDKAVSSGGRERIDVQHKKGKYTARERILMLLDVDSFVETGMFVQHSSTAFGLDKKKVDGDGVITGHGRIEGRPVYVYAQDFTVMGGSLGYAHATKIGRIFDQAIKNGIPVIGISDSGGARIQEGVKALAGYGTLFYKNASASGVIPQISAIMGPSAGGAVYSPALTDFIVMTERTSHMFITGPDVVKAVTGENLDFETLGGASIHALKSGVAHFIGSSEEESIKIIRRLHSFLPNNNLEDPPIIQKTADNKSRRNLKLDYIIPTDPKTPYDMLDVITDVVDHHDFFEIQEGWAKNIIIGFARLNGYPVGIVANQPLVLAGALDIEASIKGAKFVRFCDSFNIPIITFVDVPGFLPGMKQEHGGIIRNGAKLLYAYCESTVPKITVVTRKAFGGAYIVMSSKHLNTDVNFAWPSAEIAVMGAEAAVKIIFRKELAKAENPEEKQLEIEEEYHERFYNPYQAAAEGYIDEIILPRETRNRIIEALWPILTKREYGPKRKHGNIPL